MAITMYVRLEDEQGELVHDTHVPRSDPVPKSIAYAGAMYYLREDTAVLVPHHGSFAAIYRRGPHLEIPQPGAEVGGDGVTVIRGKAS